MSSFFLLYLPLLVLYLFKEVTLFGPFYIIYLIVYLPFLMMWALRLKQYDFWERLLLGAVAYFFVIVPIFYYVFSYFKIKLTTDSVFLFLLCFNTLLWIIKFVMTKHHPNVSKFSLSKIDWFYITFLVLFILLHKVFYIYYKSIPEWDSYGYLVRIESTINMGYLSTSYRELFNPSIVLLSIFSKIEPYGIFNFWMIFVQSNILILTKIMIDRTRITNLRKVVAYTVAFAFPILNMEMDMVRPQNIFIIALPIIFYLIYKDCISKHLSNIAIMFLISVVGFKYHEFFFFIFIVLCLYGLGMLIRQYLKSTLLVGTKDTLILVLIIVIFLLFIYIVSDKSHVFMLVKSIAVGIFDSVKDVHKWRWWFLNDYSTDGDNYQMGWLGLLGAIKYYGYYLSPAGLIMMFGFVYHFIFQKNKILYSSYFPLILILIFICFAELLPRLGYMYLPERFWLYISLSILFLSFFVIRLMNKYWLLLLLIMSFVGVSASVYVASRKKSLVSSDEFKAVEWIRDNTPEDAEFITQASNNHLISYFAKRKPIFPPSEFFMSDKLIDLIPDTSFVDKEVNALSKEVSDYLNNFDYKVTDVSVLSSFIKAKQFDYLNILKNGKPHMYTSYRPVYILYSFDKLDNLYSEREWWMKVNFFGAKLEKFSRFPLVYDLCGVKIWKYK